MTVWVGEKTGAHLYGWGENWWPPIWVGERFGAHLYGFGDKLVPTSMDWGEKLVPTSIGGGENWCPPLWVGERNWCPPLWVGERIGAHLYDLLHEELVGGHLGLLHDRDVAAHPRQEDELGPFGHLVSCLKKKISI